MIKGSGETSRPSAEKQKCPRKAGGRQHKEENRERHGTGRGGAMSLSKASCLPRLPGQEGGRGEEGDTGVRAVKVASEVSGQLGRGSVRTVLAGDEASDFPKH